MSRVPWFGRENEKENGGASPGSRPRASVLAAAIILLAVAAQVPALNGRFFFSDDMLYVTDNLDLQEVPLSRPWRLFTRWTSFWEYLPVRDLSYRVDLALFGQSPLGFKLHNLALYALSCVVCFLALRAAVRALHGVGGDLPENVIVLSALALFAVHPVHVESVAWIAGRKDLLSGIFAMAATWQFAEALSGKRPSWRRIGVAAGFYTLALLSKATVTPLPGALLLLAAARFGREQPLRAALTRAVTVTAPFLALSAASAAVVALHGGVVGRQDELDAFVFPPVARVPLALRIVGAFAHVALAPVRLRFHYDVRLPGFAGAALAGAGAAAVAAGAVGAWFAIRRRSIAGFGAATFVLFMAPFVQLVSFGTWSELCERWLFMPTFGLALAIGALAGGAARRSGMRPVAAAMLVVFSAGLAQTAHRSAEWESMDRLVTSSVARAPGHPFAAALSLLDHAPALPYAEARAAAPKMPAMVRERLLLIADAWQALAERRVADARRRVRELAGTTVPVTRRIEGLLAEQAGDDFEALRIYDGLTVRGPMRRIQQRYLPGVQALARVATERPDDVAALVALGNLQSELRLNADAVETYERILRLAPGLAAVHYNLAMVQVRQKEFAAAAAQYRLAAPQMPDAWNGLGLCERELGHLAEAERAFRTALDADPLAFAPAYNLAVTYVLARRREDARRVLLDSRERAVRNGSVATLDALMGSL